MSSPQKFMQLSPNLSPDAVKRKGKNGGPMSILVNLYPRLKKINQN
jgi:hypothetical protein